VHVADTADDGTPHIGSVIMPIRSAHLVSASLAALPRLGRGDYSAIMRRLVEVRVNVLHIVVIVQCFEQAHDRLAMSRVGVLQGLG